VNVNYDYSKLEHCIHYRRRRRHPRTHTVPSVDNTHTSRTQFCSCKAAQTTTTFLWNVIVKVDWVCNCPSEQQSQRHRTSTRSLSKGPLSLVIGIFRSSDVDESVNESLSLQHHWAVSATSQLTTKRAEGGKAHFVWMWCMHFGPEFTVSNFKKSSLVCFANIDQPALLEQCFVSLVWRMLIWTAHKTRCCALHPLILSNGNAEQKLPNVAKEDGIAQTGAFELIWPIIVLILSTQNKERQFWSHAHVHVSRTCSTLWQSLTTEVMTCRWHDHTNLMDKMPKQLPLFSHWRDSC